MLYILQGAQTVIHCATSPSLGDESGNIYRDCKLYKMKKELDHAVADKLWDISAKLSGIPGSFEMSS